MISTTFETPRVKTITLDVPDWPGHRAGQHVDVRLTAPDGYQTERSYSIASAPEDQCLSVTVELLDDGEVSPYLVDELRAGDELEFRGPIGGHFVWGDDFGGPLFLAGGGSGMVPLRAMTDRVCRDGSGRPGGVGVRRDADPDRTLRRDRSVTKMGPLDGNAMAGVLHDLFARDMTTMGYKCAGCGRTGVMAGMVVYMSGPGTVARCRDCDTILLMLTERHGMYCVDLPGMPQTADGRTTSTLKGA